MDWPEILAFIQTCASYDHKDAALKDVWDRWDKLSLSQRRRFESLCTCSPVTYMSIARCLAEHYGVEYAAKSK